jgi:TolB-like protein
VTSKIALNDLGPQEILATASDLEGRTWETHVSIERALPAVYDVSNRLSVAIVGSLWRSGDDADSSLRDYLLRELTRSLGETNRFRILDRDTIADVLQEQELVAALGSPEERRNLGQLNLADYLLVADVRRFDSNLEVLVHAIDPATGRDIVMDVYGPAESPGELTELLEELALRVYQEFPRVQGEVISVMGGGSRVRTTVQKNDRVRESSSCLLYREKEVIDVQTGQFLGMDLQPVASGVFTSIGGSRSTVTVDSASQLAEDTDLVITR